MSYVNAIVTAVDRSVDIMTSFDREIGDTRARAFFEINSLTDAIEDRIKQIEAMINELCYSSDIGTDEERHRNAIMAARLCIKREMLENLLYITRIKGDELKGELSALCGRITVLSDDSKSSMCDYIRKLNKVYNPGYSADLTTSGGSEYYVVIVDSKKYPQTAEHIRTAINIGFPEYVTLDRSGTAERRKRSLEGKRIRKIYDRDEWPMAVFREGGSDADVLYVDKRDNRGAGSSISWQMRHFPDGARVRVRVI